jgi:hypothetical protein
LPSYDEWQTLVDFVGGYRVAGEKLKAKEGWEDCGPSGSGKPYLCEDSYGFSALPGGHGTQNGGFVDVGYYGDWWNAADGNKDCTWSLANDYSGRDIGQNCSSDWFSIRCIQDNTGGGGGGNPSSSSNGGQGDNPSSSSGGGQGGGGSYNLGDTGPGGGKIFYYSAAGFTMTDNGQVCHYLEVAHVDRGGEGNSRGMRWASNDFYNTNIAGTGTAVGTGRKNTALILEMDPNAPAAKAANDYSYNVEDWFLPSKDELDLLYQNRVLAGIVEMRTGTGSDNRRWSSSQSNASNAYYQHLWNGLSDVMTKNSNAYARPIRAF